MNPDRKAKLHRFYEEVWNEGNIEATGHYFAQDYNEHNPVPGQTSAGLAGAKEAFATYKTAFPDLEFTVEEMVISGDSAVIRWHAVGTNTGPLLSLPATGRKIAVSGMDWFRFEDNHIQEGWHQFDQLGLGQQLGMSASPQAVGVVQAAYAAFGQGDMASMLALFTDDAVFTLPAALPWGGVYQGKAEIVTMFQKLAQHLDFTRFDVTQLLGAGELIVAVGRWEGLTKPGGKVTGTNFLMRWDVRGDKIARFEDFVDAGAVHAAFA